MKVEDISARFLTNVKKIGIERMEELLLYLPTKYKDFSVVAPSVTHMLGMPDTHLFKLKLLSMPERNNQKKYTKLFVSDGYTNLSIFFFHNSNRISELNKGDIIYVEGKAEQKGKYINISNPELVEGYDLGKIVPIYKGEKGVVSPFTIAQNIKIMLQNHFDMFVDFVREEYNVTDQDIQTFSDKFNNLYDVFNAIHNPSSVEESEAAMSVIKVINAKTALKTALSSSQPERNERSRISFEINEITRCLNMLPYNLTPSQKRSVWDICKDLNSDYPMDRLLSGDVGFGKTLTYAIPAVCAHRSGSAVVVLTPNTLLAIQIADEIKETFNVEGVKLVISDDEPRPTEEELKQKPIIVGTSAILHWLDAYEGEYVVDFLIVDEQQKLGSQQKICIMSEHTNFLEATATSIPRTTALVIYGNKKVSYLTECPVEKNIRTAIVGKEHQKQVMNTLRKIVEKEKKQIAVLYPVREKDYSIFDLNLKGQPIEGKVLELLSECTRDGIKSEIPYIQVLLRKAEKTKFDKLLKMNKIDIDIIEREDLEDHEENKRNVESAYLMWDKIYPGRVVKIHGGLSAEEKSKALQIAKDGLCDVIITTSVIEIGLTVPDLMGLYVKDADRYGASTLHQFRGRVSRKGGKGIFLMGVDKFTNEMSEKSRNRLELLVRFEKGYDIAEEDMRQRGFGDLEKAGKVQSGNLDGMFKGVKVTPDDVDQLIKMTGLQKAA